jgi:predicted DNA binding protein
VLEVVISFHAPPELEEGLLMKYDTRVVVIDTLHRRDGGCRSLVEVEVEPGKEGAVLREIGQLPVIFRSDIKKVGEGLLRGVITTSNCFSCCEEWMGEVFLVDVRIEPDGRVLHKMVASSNEAIRRVISRFEARGHHVELEKLRSVDDRSPLTPHQEEILHRAYERGYFDDPKGVHLRDLASEAGVSVSTLSEMLRKAQRKLIVEFLEEAP